MDFRVFVYGTLKTGEPNHHWLTNAENGLSRFLEKGRTKKKYPLVIGTMYNIPFLLDTPGVGHHVEGEIYEVDKKMLLTLDILEDHPNFYKRRKEPVMLLEREELCWTYFLHKFRPEMLKKEMLVSYNSRGTHNLPYIESTNEARTLEDL
ncbi:putative gamma-glutamylcyclotransferase CG2811 isoform X2 [Cimex lectularius]|uniref:Gamma-glutamylcyclotransferase family protein n=1 Tax=Cimex lectularius TaxID=79782 RepID=A0A8I6RG81_CIMLE|nr:putative gamma-glutamylcyclotransferase CG2811 isoform X2 [Cimex lectularius]